MSALPPVVGVESVVDAHVAATEEAGEADLLGSRLWFLKGLSRGELGSAGWRILCVIAGMSNGRTTHKRTSGGTDRRTRGCARGCVGAD